MINALGIVGLGTMGANLARNAARNGVAVSVYNRTAEKTETFINEHGKEGAFVACSSMEDLTRSLSRPRAIILMVKAGEAVDRMIDEVLPLLEDGDIIIDGGNSHYRDTDRREAALKEKGIRFVGMGISGGEEGALKGPSMMPGGDRDAIETILPLLRTMSADDGDGGKCVSYMGPGGAGHYVKMVHNGIEYAVMQLIAESYALLRSSGTEGNALADMFKSWNKGDLRSYLMEITETVLRKRDSETGSFLVDLIKDEAGQKGTGRWTVESALLHGIAVPTITAAVEARQLSGYRDVRVQNATMFPASTARGSAIPADTIHAALELATVMAYFQSFTLLAVPYGIGMQAFPIPDIARIWSGGCIIRSSLLSAFRTAWSKEATEADRLSILRRFAGEKQTLWREAVSHALGIGIPVPALASSLAYYDSMRSPQLPQNLIQAQRDYFGAHGFERVDMPGSFHVDWES